MNVLLITIFYGFRWKQILDFNADLTTSRHCAQIKTLFVAYLLSL